MNNRTKLNLFFPVVNFAFCFPVSIGFSFSYFFLNTIHVFIIKEEEKKSYHWNGGKPTIYSSFIHSFIHSKNSKKKRQDKTSSFFLYRKKSQIYLGSWIMTVIDSWCRQHFCFIGKNFNQSTKPDIVSVFKYNKKKKSFLKHSSTSTTPKPI